MHMYTYLDAKRNTLIVKPLRSYVLLREVYVSQVKKDAVLIRGRSLEQETPLVRLSGLGEFPQLEVGVA